jgi:hypothetical protein
MKRRTNIILVGVSFTLILLCCSPNFSFVRATNITSLSSIAGVKCITVNGLIDTTEWNDAQQYSLEYNARTFSWDPWRYTTNNILTLYLKNDAENIFLGVKVNNAIVGSADAELEILFDVDNSGNKTPGDIRYRIGSKSYLNSGIEKWVHNSETGNDEWQNLYEGYWDAQNIKYGLSGSQQISEGVGTIQMEMVIALSSIKLIFNYQEQYYPVSYSNFPVGYITLNTTSTTQDFLYFPDTAVITISPDSADPTKIHITWNAIPGATEYKIYKLSIEVDSSLHDPLWDDDIIANLTASDSLDVTVQREYPMAYNEYYYIVSINQYGVRSQSAGVNQAWTDTATGKSTSIFGYPIFLIGLGIAFGMTIVVKKRRK